MRLQEMSLEELEDYETKLNDMDDDSEYSLLPQKIGVYKEMYQRIRQLVKMKKEEPSYLSSIKDQLVFNLIHYGTFLKMKEQKDDYTAKQCLKQALTYDPKNPIAAYRLGFLSYKDKAYSEALHYFQLALDSQPENKGKYYSLNEQQILNAHLYLTNSALYIAKQSYEKLNLIPNQEQQELPNYEFSSLYLSLSNFETYMRQNAFYKITPNGKTTCSKEECEEIINHNPRDTIVLYFNDRDIVLSFHDRDPVKLGQDLADTLKYILLKSNKENPATRFNLQHYFQNGFAEGEVNKATFRKRFSRIKEKLDACEIPSVIHTGNKNSETNYYFDESFPYIIMYRVDEEMEYR